MGTMLEEHRRAKMSSHPAPNALSEFKCASERVQVKFCKTLNMYARDHDKITRHERSEGTKDSELVVLKDDSSESKLEDIRIASLQFLAKIAPSRCCCPHVALPKRG